MRAGRASEWARTIAAHLTKAMARGAFGQACAHKLGGLDIGPGPERGGQDGEGVMRRKLYNLMLTAAMLFASSVSAADLEVMRGRNPEDGCCRAWREDPALSGASRSSGVIHGGYLPVHRGGCWHWWYDQWVWVC